MNFQSWIQSGLGVYLIKQSSDPFQSLLGVKSRLLISNPKRRPKGAMVGTAGMGAHKGGSMTVLMDY